MNGRTESQGSFLSLAKTVQGHLSWPSLVQLKLCKFIELSPKGRDSYTLLHQLIMEIQDFEVVNVLLVFPCSDSPVFLALVLMRIEG